MERRLERTAPTILSEFLDELRALELEVSQQRRMVAGGELVRDFWSGRTKPTALLSNHGAVNRIVNAIHRAEGDVRDLARTYLPTDQLAGRIAELRASIPDVSTCDELEEEEDAA